ncbi:MAG: GDSL-type esterase/lipase family protein [Lentisphaeria bacterium]|nr:GDSL-type esterase/lipase family protein [Lentisphaeria bacterium]
MSCYRFHIVLIALFPLLVLAQATSPLVLDDFESLTGWKVDAKPAAFAAASDAAVGQGAITVTLPGSVSKKIQRGDDIRELWDKSQGLSFHIKGDGSDAWGVIGVNASYGAFSYVYFFPLKNRDWVKYTVAWSDFIPEGAVDLIGTPEGLPPSGILTLRFGCRWKIWFDNEAIPTHSFAIDHIQIETQVAAPQTSPAPPTTAPAPFANVLAKLRAREPMVIQFQGDSITAGTALADKRNERYSARLEVILRQWLGYDGISCRNRAVGGAKVNDARAWLQRDFAGGAPDLVCIWYGYNDKTGGISKDYFRQSMSDYIDRIAAATDGKSAVLLFATAPGTQGRFVMLDGYAQAMRDLAAERGLPCFDVHALLKGLGRQNLQSVMADMAHPNARGQQLIADHLAEYLVAQAGITTPKPPAATDLAANEKIAWDFESAPAGWLLEKQATISGDLASDGRRSLKLSALDDNPDHIRAWSEVIQVEPGKRYHVSAMVTNRLVSGAFGLFVATQDDGTGGTAISFEPQAIFRNRGEADKWSREEGEFTAPKNVTKVRLLFWIDKSARGDIYFDSPLIERAD